MSAALDGGTGWLLFTGLALMTGAIVTRWFITPSGSESADDAERMNDQVARLGALGSFLLVLGLGFFFLRQLIEFKDPVSPWSDEAAILLGTPWGETWLTAALASLAAVPCFALAARARRLWWAATGLTLSLGVFPALTGHASAVQELTGLYVFADTMHVWAAGAWIGGLACVLWLDRIALRSDRQTNALSRLVPPFSKVAVAAVGTLVATGLLASWQHLPEPQALVSGTWGRLLLAKLLLVAVVLSIGARNARVLTARLGSPEGNAAMRRSAAIELTAAQFVLVVTALLVRASPTGN